jgi:hypothetical protein
MRGAHIRGQARNDGIVRPAQASLDRMLRRITDEITRMETLVEGLPMRSVGESTEPDRRPDPVRD